MEVSARQTILSPGDMLGSYRIDSFLGQGGFGVTYIARDTMLDIQVAIKEYLPEKIAHRISTQVVQPRSQVDADVFNRGLANFLKEARTLARFNHPNIVRVKSVFELNGTAYMVMEYERGYDLTTIFSQRENICEAVLKKIIGPVLDGLSEVHHHGFIHRDIKPANILVRENGSPVLLDFGSARLAVGQNTDLLTAMVTVGFAPLEQYSGLDEQQGPWSDVYALGAVLYYAVTGYAPPDSTLRGAAVLNEKGDPYLPLVKLAPEGYSRSFCHAVDWALNFRVSARPQSLSQWRSRLFDDETLEQQLDRPDAATPGMTKFEPVTRPVPLQAVSPRNDSGNDRTVINVRSPAASASLRRLAEDPRPDTYEFVPTTSMDFDDDYDDKLRARNNRARRVLGRKKWAGQQYLLPGIAATVVLGVLALVIVSPWKSSPADSQPASGVVADSVAVDQSGSRNDDNNEPLVSSPVGGNTGSFSALTSDSALTPEPESATQEAPQERPAEDSQATALLTQAVQEAEEAEAERLAAARAARLEADREVQRKEALRQAQLLQQREAAVAAERERKAEAAREASRQAEIARQQARERAADLASERNAVKPLITSADMADVLSRFNALSRAIEQQDSVAMREITVPSARKNAYFDYVFRTFDKVEVDVTDISASRQDQTIRAKLSVTRLMRDNGDIAIPPDEFKSIPIYSVKETKWSAIHW